MLSTKFPFIWPSSFREDFLEINQSEIRIACMWWPCLWTNRDEMSNLYREPSIYASYQVSVHLAMQCQRRRFCLKQPIRNKNCLWWPCLFTDQDEMNILYRELYIFASYQISVHLAKGFQRRRLKCEKFTDNDKRQVMAIAHVALGKVSEKLILTWPKPIKNSCSGV